MAAAILVGCGTVTAEAGHPEPVEPCVRSQGYWKNHPNAWPVGHLMLGNPANPAHTYTARQLLLLLRQAVRGDASVNLAHQLIAAKLNIAAGSNPGPVAAELVRADVLLGAFRRSLPHDVAPRTPIGADMTWVAGKLEKYNAGLVPGSCGPVNRAPAAHAGPDQTTAVGATVTLDGTGSSDPDGQPLTFSWTLVSAPLGSTAVLASAVSAHPTFVVDLPGQYTVGLTVNDGAVTSAPDTVVVSTLNSAPTADAGSDQTRPVGATVQLSGAGSSDPDGDPLTYAWSFVSGPAGSQAVLSNPAAVAPTFVIDLPGTYVVQLHVSDGALQSAPDSVSIATSNSPPVARAGADASGLVGQMVTLDGGASSDVDGDPLTYRWSFVLRPAGSAASLDDPATAMPRFTLDAFGDYLVQLVVSDGLVDSAADTVVIGTGNTAPVARAGADRTVAAGAVVELDGSGSTDVDGHTLTYAWSLAAVPAGSTASISDRTAARPTFTADLAGAFVAQLIVHDGAIESAPDTVTITADAVQQNQPPVAVAGPDQTVSPGATVVLDGTASSDPDSDPLAYRWSLSRPAGSAAVLSDATAPSPGFVADVPGSYVAQLIVNDGLVDSAPDTVTISTTNTTPVAVAGPDQRVPTGSLVTLDGSASLDADGTPLAYVWSFLSRPPASAAALANAASAGPTFTPDLNGDYVVQLIVGDGLVESAPNTMVVTAAPAADLRMRADPVAAQPALGAQVQVWFYLRNNGPASATGVTASIPAPAGLRYSHYGAAAGTFDGTTWTIPAAMPSGTEYWITTVYVADAAGSHVLRATASTTDQVDPDPANDAAALTITPIAAADLRVSMFTPPTGTIAPGSGVGPYGLFVEILNSGPALASNVVLNFLPPAGFTVTGSSAGAGVYPGDYHPSTGVWNIGTLAAGTGRNLILSAIVNATGPTGFTVSVSSASPDPNPANNVFINPPINRPPTANAGANRAVGTYDTVMLDAGASTDPEGDALTFQWAFTLRPMGSTATLSDAASETPSFIADQRGSYVLQLSASDGRGGVNAASVTITADERNGRPVIRSTPVTTGAVGVAYRYAVLATDPDAGDTLTFALVSAPDGMAIDEATGVIDWVPSAAQAGPQAVEVRVVDAAGFPVSQAFAVQVSSASNQAPLASDDAHEVRLGESLAVGAPGVLQNDTDESPLTATLVRPPSNGTVVLGRDGSFTFTPYTQRAGELVLAQGVNLGARVPGVVVNADGSCPACVIDEDPTTEWYPGFGATQPPTMELAFPQDVSVFEVRILPYRSRTNTAAAGVLTMFDAQGTEVYTSGNVELPAPQRLGRLVLPSGVAGVRRVRFVTTAGDAGGTLGAGFTEFQVIGSALLARTASVEPNLAERLATTAAASSAFAGNAPDSINDGTPSNWYAASPSAGEFIELTFPADVRVTAIQAPNPSLTPGGFLSSVALACSGTFTLIGIDGAVLFDSGVVNEPSGGLSEPFTLAVPDVSGVRRVRYTSAGCPASFPQYTAGFSEIRVIGTTATDAPAFDARKRLHALLGREVHSTPVVVNLTDDNGDGVVDANDVPDIVVPVENPANQLRGEIVAVSGDDGRVLFTAGAPDLVSPWSEVAVGDLDGNRLIAFDRTGVELWRSDVAPLSTFNLGGSVIATGAVSIANLDGTGGPEIIVGATVFDHTGHLLGRGETLGGTTGGTNLRSAISTVADIDLDGAAELVAGPTAYRLSGGTLATAWRRADRADGFAGVGNFDDDPRAEIAIVANGVVYLLNDDGSDAEVWNAPTHAPVPLPGGGQGGAPLVADVDGDGWPEIGVAGAMSYVVFNRDGAVRWRSAISDRSSNSTGSTAFDLDGDGTLEIIYRDEYFLRIYRGSDGLLLSKVPVSSATWAEVPTVADVDNDGHADILVSSDLGSGATDTGVIVINDALNLWTRTRRIWNQHAYHVTNVTEAGAVPVVETPHWLLPGLNAFRTNAFGEGESADASDAFTYVASDGVLQSNIGTARIAVRPVNAAPRISSSAVTTAAPDVVYTYAVRAVDPDAGDVLTYSLPTAPSGMTIDAASGFIRWTPPAAGQGPQPVVVRVEDVRGLFALQGYTLQVSPAVAVPDVVGQPQAAAEGALAGATLTVGGISSRNSPTVPAGAVTTQAPPAGALVATGTPVSLVISTGPAPAGTVPDVVGQAQSSAQADIVAALFVVGAVTGQSSATVPAGVVLAQTPAAGAIAATGSPIAIVVSFGRPPGTLDLDGDGYTGDGGDCNDTNAAINPGAFDIPGDGIDQNCNGVDSVAGDATPPTATLVTPDDLAEITMPTDILGTVGDSNLLRYTVQMAEVDATTFTTIGSGTAAVTAGVVGRLDPTLLENGLYRVRLVAEDVNGQTAVDERVYRVTGEMKVGVTRLSFTDLRVPVSGIPISVERHYDSRVKTGRDFGIGWTLDVKAGTYRHNRPPGEGWIIRDQPFLGDFLPCVGGSLETRSHLTEVRLSDREVYRFALEVVNGTVGISNACEGTARYRFVDGTLPGATLQILDGTTVLYLRGGPDTVIGLDDFIASTPRPYQPLRVRLTTIDGRVIDLEGREGITRAADANGNALTISAAGIVHSSGRSIAFTRDHAGRITTIIDPRGATLGYEYDGAGDLVAFTDQGGQSTRFAYDGAHNLVDILDPSGNHGLQAEYDAEGRLIAMIDGRGARLAFTHDLAARQERIVNARGHATLVTYDDRGNVTSEGKTVTIAGVSTTATSTFEHDAAGNPIVEVDPDGVRRETSYDSDNPVRQVIDPAGLALATAVDYLAQSRPGSLTNPAGETITLNYDARGNLTRWTEPDGSVLSLVRDERGRPTATTDPAGLGTTVVHSPTGEVLREERRDGAGRLLARMDYSYDANGNRVTETETRTTGTDVRQVTTSYTFDALNRPIAVRDPAGHVARVEFNALGLESARIDPLGRRTTFAYDERGARIRTEHPDGTIESTDYDESGNAISHTNRAGATTTVQFDELNRAVRTSMPDGTVVQTVFTPAGRTAARIDAAGQRTTYDYDAAGRLVRTVMPEVVDARTAILIRPEVVRELDAMGRELAVTDPNGHRTTHAYDAAGRPTVTTFADGTTREEVYDAAGRRVATIDAAGRRTAFEYDALGRLTAVVDAAGGRTLFTYDEAGNRLTQTDALGRTTRHEYDPLNRRVRTTLPLGESETLAYDPVGNVTRHVDFNGAATIFDYDVLNWLIRRRTADGLAVSFTYTVSGQRATAVDARGTTTYTYDAHERLSRVTHPGGEVVEYHYEASGRLRQVVSPGGASDYAYDAMGRLARVSDPTGTAQYGYDAAGNLVATIGANGVTTRRTYDAVNRVREIRHLAPGGTLASYVYDYLPTGQRSRVTEADGSSEQYTYDALGRLVLETRTVTNPRTVSYAYDAVGNRTRMVRNGVEVAYTYDANDRMLTAGGTSYGYDANGSRVSQTTAGALRSFSWDGNRRLVGVTDVSGSRRFSYDADGHRVAREAGGQTTRYLIDAYNPTGLEQVLEERDSVAGLTARYTLGVTRLSMTRGGTVSFYQTDALGSTRLLTDATGAASDAYGYDAFGMTTVAVGPTANTFRFAGEEQDADHDLYNLRARWMDPSTGRFVSRDPFAGVPERPTSLHKYQYGDLDPVSNRDPLGLYTLGEAMTVQALHGNLTTLSVSALRVYNILDTVSDILTVVKMIGSMMSGGVAGLVAMPPGVSLDALTNYNPAVKRLDVEGAANALEQNMGTILSKARTPWVNFLATEGRKTEAFLFYLPSLISHPSIPLTIPGADVGFGRHKIRVRAVLGGCGLSRVIGAGMQINASMGGREPLKQIWRMSYNPLGTGAALPSGGVGCAQSPLDSWHDRPGFEYLFHVLKPR